MSAILSPCGLYRYRLDRDCGMPGHDRKVFAFFGINPSTADANLDDATVRKWRGFTVRNGGGRFVVGNVFSYRSTNVKLLESTPHPQGPDHRKHILDIIQEADVLIPCWGATTKVPPALRPAFDDLLQLLRESGKPILCFGFTRSGDPKHPLMLGYDTPLCAWSP